MSVRRLWPLALRAIVLWQLTWPAASKFLIYEERVRDFEHHGIPNPAAWVPIVGTFEVIAVIAIALGIAARLACLPMLPIMAVAIATAGLESGNAMVLIGCVGIVLFGSGALSLWQPEERWLAHLKSKLTDLHRSQGTRDAGHESERGVRD